MNSIPDTVQRDRGAALEWVRGLTTPERFWTAWDTAPVHLRRLMLSHAPAGHLGPEVLDRLMEEGWHWLDDVLANTDLDEPAATHLARRGYQAVLLNKEAGKKLLGDLERLGHPMGEDIRASLFAKASAGHRSPIAQAVRRMCGELLLELWWQGSGGILTPEELNVLARALSDQPSIVSALLRHPSATVETAELLASAARMGGLGVQELVESPLLWRSPEAISGLVGHTERLAEQALKAPEERIPKLFEACRHGRGIDAMLLLHDTLQVIDRNELTDRIPPAWLSPALSHPDRAVRDYARRAVGQLGRGRVSEAPERRKGRTR